MDSRFDALDPYRALQVREDAADEIIEAAYRRLCRMFHPDLNPSPVAVERMREINLAYEIVGNPRRRRDFDRLRQHVAAETRLAREATPPALLVDETILRPRTLRGGAQASGHFSVANRGGGLLAGTLRSSAPWLRVSPVSFAANRLVVDVRAEMDRMPRGSESRASVAVETNGGRATVEVILATPINTAETGRTPRI